LEDSPWSLAPLPTTDFKPASGLEVKSGGSASGIANRSGFRQYLTTNYKLQTRSAAHVMVEAPHTSWSKRRTRHGRSAADIIVDVPGQKAPA
jgi:hypothetical protein